MNILLIMQEIPFISFNTAHQTEKCSPLPARQSTYLAALFFVGSSIFVVSTGNHIDAIAIYDKIKHHVS